MNKIFGIIFVFVFLASFVSAQPINQSLNFTEEKETLRQKSNEVLSNEIEIPENLQKFSRVFFGLKNEEEVSLQKFIIFVGVWLVFLFLLASILEITPFFDGWKSWIGAVVVNLLVGLSGGFLLVTGFIFSLSNLFGVLENWGILTLFIGLILVALFYYLLSKLIVIIREKNGEDKMSRVGRNIAIANEIGKAHAEDFR